MVFNVAGYHTCKEKGSVQQIRDSVPFLSRAENQWLGQGYYFWTDSEYWARRWMNDPKVISKFSISIEKEKVLDLVGDVSHQELLKNILELFCEGHPYYEQFTQMYGEKVTVGTVLSFLRFQNEQCEAEDFFPFWAVRAKDNRSVAHFPFSAIGGKELFLVEPHQLCVYQEYKDQTVTFDSFVHPDHFC